MTSNKQKTCPTCINCEKEYSPTQKKIIMNKMKQRLPHFIRTYPNTCLKCIQAELNQNKKSYLSNINTASQELKQSRKAAMQANIRYQKAQDHHNTLTFKYKTLDEEEKYIDFFILQPEKTIPIKKNRKRKKNIKKQSALIKALLASMTPEQRSSIEEQIGKLPKK